MPDNEEAKAPEPPGPQEIGESLVASQYVGDVLNEDGTVKQP